MGSAAAGPTTPAAPRDSRNRPVHHERMFSWLKRRKHKSPLMQFADQSEALTDPCPACECWGLRRYTGTDGTLKVVCLNLRCTDPAWKPDDCPAWG